MSRRFSSSQRAALYLYADGKCSECGVVLEPGWHADHIAPFVDGGSTDVVNGQALCPTCNLTKGSTSMQQLRNWQVRALRSLSLWKSAPDKGFLVEATPGAGKTLFAISAVEELFQSGRASRVVVVVPNVNLERQWAEKFAGSGINVNPNWHASVGMLPADEQGCAVTYAEVANQTQIFRKLTSGQKTIVILDEVHHCAEDHTWGTGIRTAFDPAILKLLLSGTPFRSDNNEIPFVNYIDGTGAPDFRYGYEEALRDSVVRAVFFPRRGGKTEWSYNGTHVSHSFDDVLSKDDAGRRLRTAIDSSGEWVASVLKDANTQLTDLRKTDETAAGIVFCEESNSARAIHAQLSTMSPDVVLAISDEKDSDQRIRQFRDSQQRWLVSIRQVSEGVDIPRLRVGVYATNYLTPMFFRQAVGRLIRTRNDEDDPTSYLFIPDDERLRNMARDIIAARDHVLREQEEGTDRELDGEIQPSLFAPISSTSVDRGLIAGQDTITPEQLAEAERIKSQIPGAANMSAAFLAQAFQLRGEPQHPAPAAPTANPVTQADRKQSLSRQNNTAARRIAINLGMEHSHVNSTLNNVVSVRKLAQCTEDQLLQRLGHAQRWLGTGVSPL